jgi:hypothetical protein
MHGPTCVAWANLTPFSFKHTRHVHVHDGEYDAAGKMKTPPPGLGEGVIDHATPWRLLESIGFDGCEF